MNAASFADRAPATAPECVGPVPLPAELIGTLRHMAAAAGAVDLAPLAICALALLLRLRTGSEQLTVQVVHGRQEATVGSPFRLNPSEESLRSALAATSEPPLATSSSRVDVLFLVSADGRRLYGECRPALMSAPSALAWTRAFATVLAAAAAAPDRLLIEHPLVDAAERQRLLHHVHSYRAPGAVPPGIVEPFERQVERTPSAVALVDETGTRLTYRELDEQIDRLAHLLSLDGVLAGGRVALCMQRGMALVVAIHAIVRTGAGYVPLDADHPDARLASILSNSEPTHVLTDLVCRDRIPEGPWRVLEVDGPDGAPPVPSGSRSTVAQSSSNSDALLNILYTSGSTGEPKGVAYPVSGALAHLAWMQRRYPFAPGDVALFKTSPGFDVSIWELFWPLHHGATLLVCRPGGHADPAHLASLISKHEVTTVFLPPTVMAPFLNLVRSEGRLSALRWALCGGEPVTPRIREAFRTALPAATLVNCYGPTEAGTVTDEPVQADGGTTVALGHPAEHFRLPVLDEHLEPVPVGVAGEAYIGGDPGLAWGYWRAPARTAERFVADPFGTPGSRLYRTGDLCRLRDDGALEHLGRIDRQIKIRGMRVEPGEVEAALAAHGGIAECVVFADGDPARLLAFVVPTPPGDPAAATDPESLFADVRAHLPRVLPDHLLPDVVIGVPEIPATINGKVDRAALLAFLDSVEDPSALPADPLESSVAEIYRQVLDRERVGMLDTFARLGGHSLLAFRLLDTCREQLQITPPVQTLLTGTVRDVAQSIRVAQADADPAS
jgi:amino acid adenylation domain-containing protein